jgi:hypothetical protein
VRRLPGEPAGTVRRFAVSPTGRYDHAADLYYTAVPLEAGKTVAAPELPPTGDVSPAAGPHVFAVAVG